MRKNFGFTLIELLVVMAILAILASVGFGQYTNSQIKARDSQRKSDLSNIARALEMYYNDNQSYPTASNGMIVVDQGTGPTEVNWGTEFFATFGSTDVVYMKRLPKESTSETPYCYSSNEGRDFYLFSTLENENDPSYDGAYTCNGVQEYHYFINSSNAEPAPTVSP